MAILDERIFRLSVNNYSLKSIYFEAIKILLE